MRMNKWLLVAIAGAVLLLVILGVVVLMLFKHTSPANPLQTTTVPNPFGTNNPGQTTALGSMPIVLADGSEATIPDITKTTQPAWAGPESGYLVAGSDTGDYLATYIPSDGKAPSEFLVTLYAEPIGATRKVAEAGLRNRLGMTDAQLCSLWTVVATAPGVNTSYDGVNLGLSFCPGAVKLP